MISIQILWERIGKKALILVISATFLSSCEWKFNKEGLSPCEEHAADCIKDGRCAGHPDCAAHEHCPNGSKCVLHPQCVAYENKIDSLKKVNTDTVKK